ncbi:hypothetical protein EV426DRAFT_71007 [Tirmania nivea]|nr:hypothetical protein EV426DRAFT_71007 [Tirmania nivea]
MVRAVMSQCAGSVEEYVCCVEGVKCCVVSSRQASHYISQTYGYPKSHTGRAKSFGATRLFEGLCYQSRVLQVYRKVELRAPLSGYIAQWVPTISTQAFPCFAGGLINEFPGFVVLEHYLTCCSRIARYASNPQSRITIKFIWYLAGTASRWILHLRRKWRHAQPSWRKSRRNSNGEAPSPSVPIPGYRRRSPSALVRGRFLFPMAAGCNTLSTFRDNRTLVS